MNGRSRLGIQSRDPTVRFDEGRRRRESAVPFTIYIGSRRCLIRNDNDPPPRR